MPLERVNRRPSFLLTCKLTTSNFCMMLQSNCEASILIYIYLFIPIPDQAHFVFATCSYLREDECTCHAPSWCGDWLLSRSKNLFFMYSIFIFTFELWGFFLCSLIFPENFNCGMVFKLDISQDILKLLDDIETLKPTIFASVPRLYNRIFDKWVIIWIRTVSYHLNSFFLNLHESW